LSVASRAAQAVTTYKSSVKTVLSSVCSRIQTARIPSNTPRSARGGRSRRPTHHTIRIPATRKCTTGGLCNCVRDGRPPCLRRRRQSSTLRATGEASIRRRIWPPSPAFCTPIAIAGSNRCSTRRRKCGRLHQRFALPMRGSASSSWLTSREAALAGWAGGGQTPRYMREKWPCRSTATIIVGELARRPNGCTALQSVAIR